MTKREQMAMATMTGLMSNPSCSCSPKETAAWAVTCADALIAELSKGDADVDKLGGNK